MFSLKGEKINIKDIKSNNVLYFANFNAGIPSLLEDLKEVIINSLKVIIDRDQKGIILALHSQISGIIIIILSASGSSIEPVFETKFNFLANSPSR